MVRNDLKNPCFIDDGTHQYHDISVSLCFLLGDRVIMLSDIYPGLRCSTRWAALGVSRTSRHDFFFSGFLSASLGN
jgi:hypothetical protein